MNERIKELAKVAEYWANTFEDKSRYQEYLMKTFAELIVRECMDIAYDHTPNSEECEYKRLIHDKIRQHFGVER
jgi:hypothetical protein